MGFEEADGTGRRCFKRRRINVFPDKCVVDTNVPIAANDPPDRDYSRDCVIACVEAIQHVLTNGGLVVDKSGEIYREYLGKLAIGKPGPGNEFMKWVHDFQWREDKVTRVEIHCLNDTYEEFPKHDGLNNFDISDRKFVAVANGCKNMHKPPIFQATDAKWWGWKDALSTAGIEVRFLCLDYVKEKFKEKHSNKKPKSK